MHRANVSDSPGNVSSFMLCCFSKRLLLWRCSQCLFSTISGEGWCSDAEMILLLNAAQSAVALIISM